MCLRSYTRFRCGHLDPEPEYEFCMMARLDACGREPRPCGFYQDMEMPTFGLCDESNCMLSRLDGYGPVTDVIKDATSMPNATSATIPCASAVDRTSKAPKLT